MPLGSAIRRSIRLVPWRWRDRVKTWPLVGPLQRKMIEVFASGTEFTHTVDRGPGRGLVFPVTLPEDKGIWAGTYELDFVSAIADAINPEMVCYDIGGWKGYVSGVMALAGARSVLVFEPLPTNIGHIERIRSLNPQLPIHLVEAAVGEKSGPGAFRVMSDSSMGKLAESPFQQNVDEADMIGVERISLDDFVEAQGTELPDLIKIDVEGAEAFVLQGAKNLLRSRHPALFIEAHSPSLCKECEDILRSLDYHVESIRFTGAVGARDELVSHIRAMKEE